MRSLLCSVLTLLPALAGCAGESGPEGSATGSVPLTVERLGTALATTTVEPQRVSRDHLLSDGALLAPGQVRRVELAVGTVDPSLRFGFVVTDPGDDIRACIEAHPFTVDLVPLEPRGSETRIFEQPVERPDWHEYWHWGQVDLTRWQGQRVELRFGLGRAGQREPACGSFQGAFGDVQLVSGERQDTQPDLLLVVVDTMRGDHVGMLEGAPVRTPNLVAWSDQGAWFDDALAPSSWTKESVYALLSGTYLTVGDVRPEAEGVRLPEDVPVLTERLQAAGYRTVALMCNPILEPPDRTERGFDLFRATSDAEVANDLEELLGASDPRQPRFVYVHLMGPHLDYCYRDEISAPHFEAIGQPDNPRWCMKVGRDPQEWTEDLKVRSQAYYRGEVEYADHVTSQVLALMSDAGREPWLVFTADHGEEFWDHGGYEHGHTLLQEVVRVPLLLRPPSGGDWVTGRQHDPVSLVDVAHTLLDVAGLEPLDTPAGVSLLPVLRGESLPPERVRLTAGTIYGPARVATVIEGRKTSWNLGYAQEPASVEIYDLQADPEELTPLASTDDASVSGSAWAAFQHLATTGSATLRVELGPTGEAALHLSFDTDGEALLAHVEPAEAEVSFEERAGGFELVASGERAATAWIQLDGLRERTRVVDARASVPAGLGTVDWPDGSVESDGEVAIPTPWWRYRPAQRETSLEDGRVARVRWGQPGGWTPGGAAKHPDTTEELRALGYME